MLDLAKKNLQLAYAPYSGFAVGACLRTESGQLFGGCNIENASYGLTLCAEASAISQLVTAGHRKWLEILITSSGKELCFPCGACRQRLFEFALPNSVCHLYSSDGNYSRVDMSELFPFPFGAFNLEAK